MKKSMLDYNEVLESIRVLRERLKAVNRENKNLKEKLRAKEEGIDSRVKKVKSAVDDARFVQKLLYSVLGNIEMHPVLSTTKFLNYGSLVSVP